MSFFETIKAVSGVISIANNLKNLFSKNAKKNSEAIKLLRIKQNELKTLVKLMRQENIEFKGKMSEDVFKFKEEYIEKIIRLEIKIAEMIEKS